MLGVESIAGEGGGLEVILGLGVVLTFGGLLLRAVGGRFARSRAGTAVRAWLDAAAQPSAEPSASSNRERVSPVAGRARELAVLADLCEPESRRLSEGCLAPLGRTLNVSRRLLVAEESVAFALAALPVEAWLVERNVLVGALRIPFVALGATGVFAICPTGGPCSPDDLVLIDEAAERVRQQLPGYEGRCRGPHKRTLALWRTCTEQLDEVLTAPRFKRIKANRLLQGISDKEGALYNEVYTLPQ